MIRNLMFHDRGGPVLGGRGPSKVGNLLGGPTIQVLMCWGGGWDLSLLVKIPFFR